MVDARSSGATEARLVGVLNHEGIAEETSREVREFTVSIHHDDDLEWR